MAKDYASYFKVDTTSEVNILDYYVYKQLVVMRKWSRDIIYVSTIILSGNI